MTEGDGNKRDVEKETPECEGEGDEASEADVEKPASDVDETRGAAESEDDPPEIATSRTSAAVKALKIASPATPPRVRGYILPLLTLGLLTVLLLQFRTVLMPFIFACLVVYLMEPIVSRIGRGPDHDTGPPRWVAVILVYLVFISSVAVFLLTVVPRFVSEFVRLGETLPEVVQDFRQESLPVIDKQVQGFIQSYLPVAGEADAGAPVASSLVAEARAVASANTLAFGSAQSIVEYASKSRVEARTEEAAGDSAVYRYVIMPRGDPPELLTLADSMESSWRYTDSDDAAIRVVPERNGNGFLIYMNAVELDIEKSENGEGWRVRRHSPDMLDVRRSSVSSAFNLQRSVDEVIETLVDTSTERIANIVDLARALVVGVVQAFVGIVLTLMVAAFISIDLFRVRRFFRGMVPADGRPGYDRFLQMADRGLSGVVRGQLLICLVNGVLTYIGLAIIGVKFSVLLAVVAGILSLIPVFGTILSTVPIVLIALTDGFTTGVLALGWILLIHFVEANFLNPKIIGSAAHIHPVIVIFALLAGESAYGLVGALLAVPTASLILTAFNFVRTKAWRVSEDDSEVAAV